MLGNHDDDDDDDDADDADADHDDGDRGGRRVDDDHTVFTLNFQVCLHRPTHKVSLSSLIASVQKFHLVRHLAKQPVDIKQMYCAS